MTAKVSKYNPKKLKTNERILFLSNFKSGATVRDMAFSWGMTDIEVEEIIRTELLRCGGEVRSVIDSLAFVNSVESYFIEMFERGMDVLAIAHFHSLITGELFPCYKVERPIRETLKRLHDTRGAEK